MIFKLIAVLVPTSLNYLVSTCEIMFEYHKLRVWRIRNVTKKANFISLFHISYSNRFVLIISVIFFYAISNWIVWNQFELTCSPASRGATPRHGYRLQLNMFIKKRWNCFIRIELNELIYLNVYIIIYIDNYPK